jgi:predicted  nucleic acid-binding Zn-ribbon protein
MPHQCTKCGSTYPDAAQELLKGCSCGSKFFYYIKQEKYDELNRLQSAEIINTINELSHANKEQIEQDIRELTGMEENDEPVILDVESVRILEPGKFEIDLVNLFSKKRPLIYQLEEGKYIIDLNASIKVKKEEIDKKIRDPKKVVEEKS